MTPDGYRALRILIHWSWLLVPFLSFDQTAMSDAHADGANWIYRADLPDARPVARTVGLYRERPEDLAGEPEASGLSRRYAQIRYGSKNSRRVAVIVDEWGNGKFTVYVDSDRDRTVTAEERIESNGRSWRTELAAEIIEGVMPLQFPRVVMMRLASTGDRLSIATLGGMSGRVSIADAASGLPVSIGARRIDGDANGLFADSRDRLQVDLSQDGDFNLVTEQFAWLPVMTLAGRRYAVKADREGESLSLDEIVGTGQLQVTIAKLPTKARITAFEAMVFSDDASAWSLKEAGKLQEVPVGRYALGSITLTIDAGEGEPWHFVFSRSQAVEEKDWVEVAANGEVSLEAIGDTRLVLNTSTDQIRPGEQLAVSPRLYTHGGLLVNLSCRGRQIGSFDNARYHNFCEIRLLSGKGETLSSAHSGFV